MECPQTSVWGFGSSRYSRHDKHESVDSMGWKPAFIFSWRDWIARVISDSLSFLLCSARNLSSALARCWFKISSDSLISLTSYVIFSHFSVANFASFSDFRIFSILSMIYSWRVSIWVSVSCSFFLTSRSSSLSLLISWTMPLELLSLFLSEDSASYSYSFRSDFSLMKFFVRVSRVAFNSLFSFSNFSRLSFALRRSLDNSPIC